MRWLAFIITSLVVILDLFVKYIVRAYLPYGKPVKVIGDFFRLTYVANPGISFGLFSWSNFQYKYIILSILSFFALIVVFYVYMSIRRGLKYQNLRKQVVLIDIFFGFIAGGALGNLIERLIRGKVTDFIDIGIKDLRWFTFNVADSFITIGGISALILLIYLESKGNLLLDFKGSWKAIKASFSNIPTLLKYYSYKLKIFLYNRIYGKMLAVFTFRKIRREFFLLKRDVEDIFNRYYDLIPIPRGKNVIKYISQKGNTIYLVVFNDDVQRKIKILGFYDEGFFKIPDEYRVLPIYSVNEIFDKIVSTLKKMKEEAKSGGKEEVL